MKIQIDPTDVENNNNMFDILTITDEPFIYLGDGNLEVTITQFRLLELNNAKFKVVKE